MNNYIIVFTLSISLFIPTFTTAAQVNIDGSLKHSVDITIPPGTNGLAPKLSLDYNSNAGNGLVGMGWQLNGFPIITRDHRFAINYRDTDSYCGRGGRLINQGNNIYHYEREDYSKIEMYGSLDNPTYWVETRVDGTRYYYGNYNNNSSANVEAILFDKQGNPIEGKTRVWALSKVEDIYGNFYTIEYKTDNGELYPGRITYTQGQDISRYRIVDFEYESRNDYGYSYEQS